MGADRERSGWRWAAAWVLACVLGTAGCGGEVVGVGNSGNRFHVDEARELAQALVATGVVPEVSDAQLEEIYGQILDRARLGDVRAALVVVRIAEAQRVEE